MPERKNSSVDIIGTKCETVTYKTSIFDVFTKLRAKVCEVFSISTDTYVEDKKLYRLIEYGGSHSWYEKTLIKETPTEEELEAIQALDTIEKVLKKHFEKGT